ncbi:type II/IV secretion system protein [Moraxellaceae bacterium AER2_44_116]|nr:type II/IV secretion system protein [Moraxellaceae bacterium AER2_44_116]
MSLPNLFISTGRHDQSVVELLNTLFQDGAGAGVSDVHIEEEATGGVIRWRRRGKMESVRKVSTDEFREINAKIRSRSNLPLSETKTPLDGRTSLRFDGHGLDLRISIQPTIYGQSIVCRLLDQRNAGRNLRDIMMTPAVRASIDNIIREPSGLFLVTGPTGSGKTSTLYSILNELNTDDRKIQTIEDPVEYRLPLLQQVNVDQHNTFALALRAALRQDPDVILVGEIRDQETAKIAVQAAMTGHLVLSTLHTNDAPSSIGRLLNFGLDPAQLAISLRGIIAQRLVRRLRHSHIRRKPDASEVRWLQHHKMANYVDKTFGTEAEGNLYDGMVPIMELLMADNKVREAIAKSDERLISRLIRNQPQYETLTEASVRTASEGHTSLEEVRSIIGSATHHEKQSSLGEMLIQLGHLTPYQLEQVTLLQQQSSIELEDVLLEYHFCAREAIDDARNQMAV